MLKNVLVCGCNGYIGNALVQRLLKQGYDVVGIDNQSKLK
jgi:nucleoside-diphosphate-sugar epimerase